MHEVESPDPPAEPRAPSDLPRAFRPREKLFARGPGALTHSELMSLVLRSSPRSKSGPRLVNGLLRRHGLSGLAGMSPDAWSAEKGLSRVAAARLCAVFELGRRAYGREQDEQRPRLNGPRQVFRRVRHLGRAKKEHLVGLYLDAQNGLLSQETISIGSLNTTRTRERSCIPPSRAWRWASSWSTTIPAAAPILRPRIWSSPSSCSGQASLWASSCTTT